MAHLIVSGVGKAYKEYDTKWSRAIEWLFPFLGGRHRLKWVSKDLSFSLGAGESLGIIGVNGAGKSTLLKMIVGTTIPTIGTIQVGGRIAALLELGIGFHPDFTGRQNVITAGQLLGYSHEEILDLMPEIEAFAEIGDYIDKPVRVYSSGMQVRLAFSIATARRPDVFLIDEALSVGDVFFQQKCVERILSYKSQGTALLLVTHDFGALAKICDRSIVLHNGHQKFDGHTHEAIETYFSLLAEEKMDVSFFAENSSSVAVGAMDVNRYIRSVAVIGSAGNEDVLVCGDGVGLIRIELSNLESYSDPHVGIRIQDKRGTIFYETNSYCLGVSPKLDTVDMAHFILDVEFEVNMGPGEYTLAIGIENGGSGLGVFESVICPTRKLHNFVVVANDSGAIWSGVANLFARYRFTAVDGD